MGIGGAAPPAFTHARDLTGHDKSVASIKFSPDGTRLAGGHFGTQLHNLVCAGNLTPPPPARAIR
jgi:WD40 repeat protein